MRTFAALLVGVALSMMPSPALAGQAVTVSDLSLRAEEFAGEEVTVEGELVGDYGQRTDGSMWTQLNGDTYARTPIPDGGVPVGGNIGIGVRMPEGLFTDLDPPGRYWRRGPVVRLTGIWKYHDPDRQGESYLEVHTLTHVEPGRPVHHVSARGRQSSPEYPGHRLPPAIREWRVVGLAAGSSGRTPPRDADTI